MKKGFTLIEIMAVITILGIIGLIAVITVDKTIKDNNEKVYQMQISNIEDAARIWGTNNLSYLPDNSDEVVSIPLVALKKDGLIDKEITNPKTNELFPNDLYITISYKEGVYSYDVVEDSGVSTDNDLEVPIIILFDTLHKQITDGNIPGLDGVAILRNGQKIELDSGSSYITIDTDLNLSVSDLYNYSVTVNDGKSFTMTRKIKVK